MKIARSTCVWKGWLEIGLKFCHLCEKSTSGRVKNVKTGAVEPLCLECARKKGLA